MMMHNIYTALFRFAVTMLVGAACIGCFDLPSESKIEGFRVLGMTAEPPDITPGEGTRLEVLWADPEGEGQAVSFAWIGCLGYLHSSSGLSACEMILPPVVETAENGGDVLEIPFTPEDILDYDMLVQKDPGGKRWAQVTFIVLMCNGGILPDSDEYEGLKDTRNINTLCDGGEGISVYKTVVVSESDEPQLNPEIERLTADGTELTDGEDAEPFVVRCSRADGCGAEVDIEGFFTEESPQTYEDIEFGETVTLTEKLSIAWYVTGGDVKMPTAGPAGDDALGPYENVWRPKKPGNFILYAVAHDNRGGVSWRAYPFEVRSP